MNTDDLLQESLAQNATHIKSAPSATKLDN